MNRNEIEELLEKYKVISFDIFDTLLIRPYLNPNHLFLHMERYTGVSGFAQMRYEAECEARKTSSSEDVTIDEIYALVSKKYQYLKQLEMDFEEKLLIKNPDVFQIYQEALRQNKTIIIVSDMYLPKQFLEKVLHKNGYTSWDKFYLSSQEGVAKYSGHLYQKVIDDLCILPQEILHIGDSYETDIIQADRCGIDTYYIPKNSERFFARPAHKKFKQIYNQLPNSLEVSLILSTLVEKWVKTKKDFYHSSDAYWMDFGYCVGGAIGYGFHTFISQNITSNSDVLFVARDGYTLKRIFDVVNKRNDVFGFYVYAQRILRARILLDWKDNDNADLVLSCLKEAIGELPYLENYSEKEQFLKKNISILKEKAESKKHEYLEYLISLGINPHRNLFVIDSGAEHFSAQSLLERILNKSIIGIYTKANKDNAVKMGMDYFSWSQNSPLKFRCVTAIIEFVLMAPEAPLSDLNHGQPIYQQVTKMEEKRNNLARQISDSIIEFSKDIHRRLSDFTITFSAFEVNNYLEAIYSSFTKTDQRMLKSIYCPSNALNNMYKQTLYEQIMSYYNLTNKISFLGFCVLKIIKKFNNIQINLLGIPLLNISKNSEKSYVKLFSLLPFFKIEKRKNKSYVYLFNAIKILKIN